VPVHFWFLTLPLLFLLRKRTRQWKMPESKTTIYQNKGPDTDTDTDTDADARPYVTTTGVSEELLELKAILEEKIFNIQEQIDAMKINLHDITVQKQDRRKRKTKTNLKATT